MSKNAGKSPKKRAVLSYRRRRELYGYGFIGLWLVGAVVFFLLPLITSLVWAFCDVNVDIGRTQLDGVGFKNFAYSLTADPYYTEYLGDMLAETLWKTPLVLIFSLFIAVLLNDNFRGRTLARAVFFLPVIIATGPVYAVISGDMSNTGNMSAERFSTVFSTDMVVRLLQFLGIYGISDDMGRMITAVGDNIFGIVWSSGVQILLFLAALQNIPPSAREAAQLEGASAWDFFWKITFPYVSPFILANLIFTVIDSFTSPMNSVMRRILEMRSDWQFGYASAMAWSYFGVILLIVGIVTLFVNKFIYYEVD